jgi:sphinganine-1-phosphate aldolase
VISSFPRQGLGIEKVRERLNSLRAEDSDKQVLDWKHRCFLYTFFVNKDVSAISEEASLQFLGTDSLGGASFPSLRTLRRDLLAYATELLNGDKEVAGFVTTGGTESIIISMKCARDWAREALPHIDAPEIICPTTAHPAYYKAGELLGFRVIPVHVLAGSEVDPDAICAAITENTIGIVGSAPNLWYGVMDPIEDLAKIAAARNLWLHVDACIGGFLAPFVKRLGYDIPAFDFSLPGVRSVSADLHKYGYAPKGASIVLMRTREDAKHGIFRFKDEFTDYFTPGLSGTRGGGPIAAAWAVMTLLGEDGFMRAAADVMQCADRTRALARQEGVQVRGKQLLGIASLESTDFDMTAVASNLMSRGWVPNVFRTPPYIHLRFAPAHAQIIDEFLGDFRKSVVEAREGKASAAIRTGAYAEG